MTKNTETKDMTYGEYIADCCTLYALRNPQARFIGYNTIYGSRMYKTLNGVPEKQCIETPVAENLMVGLAIGMCLEGFLPVLCFERHDFLLFGLDGLVNHVDKLSWLSGNQYKLPVIIRAIVGAKEPLDAGPQHTQNYTNALRDMMKFTEVYEPMSPHGFTRVWEQIAGRTISGAVVIIEHRDRYTWKLNKDNNMFSNPKGDKT